MPSIRVELVEISSSASEDRDGQDELYILAGLTDGHTCSSVSSTPLAVREGTTYPFPEQDRVLFNHTEVLPTATIRGGVLLYDDDGNISWNKREALQQAVQNTLENSVGQTGEEILNRIELTAVDVLATGNRQPVLGRYPLEIRASGAATEEELEWHCKHGNLLAEVLGRTTWDYRIRFKVTRSSDLITDTVRY